MTVAGMMQIVCRNILADDPDKAELSSQDVRNIQAHISREIGITVDDRDVKIYFVSFVAAYWKTHDKKPNRSKDWRLQHA